MMDFISFHVLFLFSILFLFLSYFGLRLRVWCDVDLKANTWPFRIG